MVVVWTTRRSISIAVVSIAALGLAGLFGVGWMLARSVPARIAHVDFLRASAEEYRRRVLTFFGHALRHEPRADPPLPPLSPTTGARTMN